MALLELEDVDARYGPVHALHGVSLQVPEGEMVAVLGANGAGKTTTLRAISNTCARRARFASTGGRSPAAARGGRAARHRARARGPRDRSASSPSSENLRLGAYIAPRPRRRTRDRRRVLEYFPRLAERGGQQAGTLSGGEQQMLALGRALMARPRLLMLDEPSLGLAPLIVREIFEILERAEPRGRAHRARRRAERRPRAAHVPPGLRARGRPRRPRRRERSVCASTSPSGGATWATEWPEFWQQVVSGLATGRDLREPRARDRPHLPLDRVINFAQGEMATFSTFIAWQLMEWGMPYWGAFFLTLALSFLGGVLVERTLIRPVERAPVLTIVMVTLGGLILLNGLIGWIWGSETKRFPSAFSTRPIDVGGVAFSIQDFGVIAVTFGAVALLYLLFQFTKLGLGMRAAALAPDASRLLGVRVSLDARARLGARRDARRARRDDGRADDVPRPEHDAGRSCSTRSPRPCSAASTARSARSSAASRSA